MDKRKLIEKAKKENVELIFERFEKQKPQCFFGISGGCCKNCFQGPCRIIPGKSEKGICGANADVIAIRNILRMCSAGASAHVDHAREVLLALDAIVHNKTKAYKIKDETKLRRIAKSLGKKYKGEIKKVAEEVVKEGLEDFRRQHGVFHIRGEGKYLNWLRINANEERKERWKELGILPINFDLEISRAQHATTLGNDADLLSLILQTLRIGLVDGYAMHLSTNMQDIIFGTPRLIEAEANLGTIKKDYVNIAVHGHVPLLSQKIVEWAKKLENKARRVGAKGVNVIGVCCSGHEVLMRYGISIASHILESELPIVTGALEAMVVDTQCIYPSLQDVASCYHTKIITTMVAKIPKAMHIPFSVEKADEMAKKIVLEAINNFKNRGKKIFIPKQKTKVITGFSVETILELLSKLNKKDPLKPLIDSIVEGKVRGIAAVIGCRNIKAKKKFGEKLIKILLKNNVLVLTTGCIAHAAAQEGLMERNAKKFAGKGLREFLEKIEKVSHFPIPCVWHMGSCVDNSRIETLVNLISNKLKVPIPKLPLVASAPEWMTEKSIAIAFWALALGISTHLNPFPPIASSENTKKFLMEELEDITGAKILVGETPEDAAKVMLEHIENKRKELLSILKL
jgi:carbon-monoxide dehydrogenase catalytic subunit